MAVWNNEKLDDAIAEKIVVGLSVDRCLEVNRMVIKAEGMLQH